MSEFIYLKIAEVKLETSDSITIVFDKPANYTYQAGQFITLVLTINGQEVRRSYSFSSSPVTDEKPAITIKKISGGLVSTYLYTQAYVGLELKTLAPAGTFVASNQSGKKRTVVLIGGGSGITPLFSMAKTIIAQEAESKVYLLYTNSNENSIILKNDIELLSKSANGRFTCIHTLTKPSSAWFGLTGRINKDNLHTYLEQFPVIYPKESEYYLCGPNQLMDAVTSGLVELGVPMLNIKKEKFTATATTGNAPASEFKGVSTVSAKIRNVVQTFEVKANETILSAAQKAGIKLPYSCENGVCTACMVTCTDGVVDMEDNDTLSPNEIAKGYVLTCCGYARSATVSLDTM